MGDFNNESEESAEIEEFKNSGFVDTFRILHPNEPHVNTHHAFKGNRIGTKIDFIWCESSLAESIQNAAIIYDNDNERYPSDHFPVIAQVLF